MVLMFMVLFLCGAMNLSAQGRQDQAGNALSERQKSVVSISVFTANGDRERLTGALNEGLDNGLTVNEIGEILLQLYAYVGFPRSLNGMAALTAVLEERQAAGITDPSGEEPDFLPENVNRYALGLANLSALAGFPLKQQKGERNGYAQAMDAFLKEHLFADIFGRDNLPFDMRELATISALSALDGTNSQLMFHMSAAMNTGLCDEQMDGFVDRIDQELGKERAENTASVLEQVLARRAEMTSAPGASAGGDKSFIPELFPVGQLSGNEQIFTGDSWVAPLVPFDQSGGIGVVNVTFAPDTRTTWHAHSYVQILLSTLGTGYYQEEGKEPRLLKPGESVAIPAGVTHWHGSAPGQWFAHIAVIVPVESGETDKWLGPVDEEYYFSLD